MSDTVARAGLALGGAVAGFFIGGPVGAAIGFTAGNLVGNALFPEEVAPVEGPRLNDLSVTTSTYGKGIPVFYGAVVVSANMIWATDIVEVKKTETQGGGKKGGGGGGQTVTTYEYFGNFAMSFGEGPAQLVRRIWANGKLIVDLSDNADRARMFKYGAQKYRFYLGTETQLPDPLIESVEGVGQVEAYRGEIYVVFENFPLQDFGNRIPSIKAEVVKDAPVSLSQTNYSVKVGDHARDTAALDFGSPHIIDWHSNQVTKFNRLTGQQAFSFDTDTNTDFTDYLTANGFDTFIAEQGFGRPFVDPVTGDIYLGNEGATLDGGGVSIWDKNGAFVNYIHFGANGSPKNGIVVSTNGGITRLAVFCTGLRGNVMRTYQWAPDFLNPEDERGVITSKDTFTASDVGNDPTWVNFAYDPTAGAERLWSVHATSGSNAGPPIIHSISIDGEISDGTTVAGITSEILGISYDVVTDTLLLLTDDAVYKLDAETYAILDQIGDGVAASDGGNVGTPSVFLSNLMANQPTVVGLFHFVALRESGEPVGSNNLVRIETTSLNVLFRYNDEDDFSPNGAFGDNGGMWDPVIPGFWTTTGGFNVYEFDSYGLNGATLSSVVSDLASRAGLDTTDDIDVSDLTGVTVAGYLISDPTTVRATIETLQSAYFFDGVETDGKIVFKRRIGAAVGAVPFSEVAARAGAGSDEVPPRVLETRRQESEVPRTVEVTYMLEANDYNVATQLEQRILDVAGDDLSGITRSRRKLQLRLPIVLTDQEAREIANVTLNTAWVERDSVSFTLPPKWLRLDPGDNITIEKISPALTATLSIRLTSVDIGPGGVVSATGVLREVAVYSPNVEGAVSPTFPAAPIPYPVDTEAFLLNLPNIRDELDNDGAAWFGGAPAWYTDNPDWSGAVLLCSAASDGPFVEAAAVIDQTNWGVARTVLGTYSRYTVFDDTNTIDVEVMGNAVPSSVTDLVLFDDVNYLYIPETGELLQFGTATLVSGRTYQLSHLLRGRLGTEGSIAANSINTTVVFVDVNNMDRFSSLSERATTRYYRSASIGSDVNETPVTSFMNSSECLKPLSIVDIIGNRDGSNNLTVTFKRRTRLNGEWQDEVDVPLNETIERYEADVLTLADPDFSSVVFLVPGDTTVNDVKSGRVGTAGDEIQVQSGTVKFGAGALEFSPTGDVNPTAARIKYDDAAAIELGSGAYTVECWVRFKSLAYTGAGQVIASKYDSVFDNRSWLLRMNGGTDLEFTYYTDGSLGSASTVQGAWPGGAPSVDTWYHVAACKDGSGDLRIFVDGTQVGSTEVGAGTPDDNAFSELQISGFDDGTNDQPLDGFVDDFRITKGVGRYTTTFTPPTEAFPVSASATTSVRTLVAGSNKEFYYSAADQTTDGFTPGDPVDINTYQISETVGRGKVRAATV